MAATMEENLRTLLLSDDTIKNAVGARVSYNHVPQADDLPYIFFEQSGSTDDTALGDSSGLPTRLQYALEVWGDKAFSAKSLGRRVQQYLHKYRGAFGDSTVQGIFAESQDDNYVPRGIMDDEGFHGSFLNVEVVL